MRGRKPKPTKLKKLAGVAPRRINQNEARVPPSIPECPAFLDDVAKAQWAKMAAKLEGYGIITDIDETALAAYCEAYSRWSKAVDHIRQNGAIIEGKNSDYPIQSPYLPILTKAFMQMHTMLVELGLSPSSRSRIHAEKKKPDAKHQETLERLLGPSLVQ